MSLQGSSFGPASPLGYFDRVFFFFFFLNYKLSAGTEEQGRANRQVEIDEKLVKDHLREVGATEISVNSPQLYP
jgi:hypothetical protein